MKRLPKFDDILGGKDGVVMDRRNLNVLRRLWSEKTQTED